MNADTIRSVTPTSVLSAQECGRADDLSMLRSEVEMLVEEDTQLMKIAGAAALFVSNLKGSALPESALIAGSILAKLISEIPDDTMCDALEMLGY